MLFCSFLQTRGRVGDLRVANPLLTFKPRIRQRSCASSPALCCVNWFEAAENGCRSISFLLQGESSRLKQRRFDERRIRKDHGPANHATSEHLALSPCKQEKTANTGIHGKRLPAGRDNSCLKLLLIRIVSAIALTTLPAE